MKSWYKIFFLLLLFFIVKSSMGNCDSCKIKKQVDPAQVGVALKKDTSLFTLAITDSLNYYHHGKYLALVIKGKGGFALAKAKKDSLKLWINGICFSNIKPLWLNEKDSSVIFKLAYDTLRSSPWHLFYAYPNYFMFEHTVTLNLGTTYKLFAQYKSVSITLHTSYKDLFWLGYLLFIIIFMGVIVKYKSCLRIPACMFYLFVFLNHGISLVGMGV